MTTTIIQGDARAELARFPDGHFHCVVTSPPYWGLRDYSLEPLIWGDGECEHEWGEEIVGGEGYENREGRWNHGLSCESKPEAWRKETRQGSFCRRCNAWCGSLGLEPDPALYVAHLVAVMREVRRVLHPTGCLFLNMGDSYNAAGRDGHGTRIGYKQGTNRASAAGADKNRPTAPSLKPKDLLLMPARVALALQADGWWLRAEIVWCLSGGTKVYAKTQKGEMPMSIREMCRLRPETVRLWSGDHWLRVFGWNETRPSESYEVYLRNGQRISCTGDHRWPVAERSMGVPTSELRIGDILLSVLLPEPTEPMTPEGVPDWIGRIVGLYIAEGYEDDALGFALHSAETGLTDEIKAFAAFYGGSVSVHDYGNKRTVRVEGPGPLGIIRMYVTGTGSANKHLSMRAWQRSNAFLHGVATGYLEGDGYFDEPNDRWRLGFTRNEPWASDLRTLSARLGASVRLDWAWHQMGERRFRGFRGEWRWDASKRRTRDTEIMRISRSKGRRFFHIGVEEPHVFALASGVLTHNSKPNPMPESVTDRPTRSHEMVYLLTKASRYFWDAEAVREDGSPNTHRRAAIGAEPSMRFKMDRVGSGNRNNPSFQAAMKDLPPGSGHNLRSVWTIPTQPYKGAHFATFPEKLVERCILAGTSERGCCPECGKPWQRVVERRHQPHPNRWSQVANAPGDYSLETGTYAEKGSSQGLGVATISDTIGWRPGCRHDQTPVPCRVLDPFMGAGTALVVARKLGRNGVGIDLNADYCELARRRLERTNPTLFAWAPPGRAAPTNCPACDSALGSNPECSTCKGAGR